MKNSRNIKLTATVISLLLLSTVYATHAFADSTDIQKKAVAEKKYQDAVQKAVAELTKNKKNANGDTKKIGDAYKKYNLAITKAKADYESFKKSLKPVVQNNKNTKAYAQALDKANKEYNAAINLAVKNYDKALDAAEKKFAQKTATAKSQSEKNEIKQNYTVEITYAKSVFNYAIQKIKADYQKQVVAIKSAK